MALINKTLLINLIVALSNLGKQNTLFSHDMTLAKSVYIIKIV